MRGVTFVVRSLMAFVVVGLITSCTDGPTAPERSTQAVSLAVGQAPTGETITTDKDDYAPGETVVITGSGWQAGDSVDFVMTEEPATHEPHTWTVGADEAGGFVDDHFVVEDHDLGVTFTLTATSRATGATATAVFTDGNFTFAFSPAGLLTSVSYLRFNGSLTCSGTPSANTWTTGNIGLNTSGGGQSIQFTVPSVAGYTFTGYTTDGATVSPASSAATTVYCVSGNAPATPLKTITLNYVAIATNQKPTADPGGPYTTDEGSVKQLDGSGSTDPEDLDDITYLWSVDVTGNTLPYVAIDPSGSCKFYGTSDASDAGTATSTLKQPYIQCTDDGVFKLTLVVTDKGSPALSSTPAETQLTVSNVAPSVVLSPTSKTINEGGTASFTAVITDPGSNDAVASYAWTPTTGACTVTSSTQTSATYTCTDDYDAKVRLTVKDDDDGEGYGEADLKSNNVAPSITSLSVAPALVKIGDPVTLSATFADPGTGDTFTGSSINWDDGSSTDNTPTVNYNTGTATGTASKSHTYSATGIYEVSLTILDDDGGSDTKTFQYVVVYDPTAGFVTGGGWINSPQGACRLDACTYETVGKANFGFVSKYLKGANTPTGNTEFQFHAGGLNFSSTSYQWLVVQGANKATYKGAGTVNGVSGYKFLIYAYDGGPSNDQFRIKIWTESVDGYGNTIENVVYDNQMGQSIDANAGTLIAGGSIVIHK
jgi:hypothetical protein